jgi:hypothetical protein
MQSASTVDLIKVEGVMTTADLQTGPHSAWVRVYRTPEVLGAGWSASPVCQQLYAFGRDVLILFRWNRRRGSAGRAYHLTGSTSGDDACSGSVPTAHAIQGAARRCPAPKQTGLPRNTNVSEPATYRSRGPGGGASGFRIAPGCGQEAVGGLAAPRKRGNGQITRQQPRIKPARSVSAPVKL